MGLIDGVNEQAVPRSFATLEEYAAATGQDTHSVLINYGDFVNVPQLDAQDLATVQNVYDGRAIDFTLVEGSAAINAGVHIPNITDGFNGAAPDLGAVESGELLPVYGPRR